MGKIKTFQTTLGLMALVMSTTGCMSQRSPMIRQSQQSTLNLQPPVVTVPTPNPTPTVTAPTPTPSPSQRPGYPVQSYRVEAIGYRNASVTVSARNILRVRFSPGRQDQTVAGTGFAPAYSQLGVYVRVGSTERPTPMLSNGLARAASRSGILDFSGQIPRTCASSDSSCRETVTITVTKPNNDYWCFNFGMYCAWTQVHDTHPWNGTLEIETDDTEMLQ